MLDLIKRLAKKRYYQEKNDVFSKNYIQNLRDQILESDYLAKNHLNYRFSTTLGFSVIFKTETINKVKDKFPYFCEYIDQTISNKYNAYYLNPLLIPLDAKVEPHIDKSLRSYCLDVPTPERVSVLYIDIPKMSGGKLILYNDEKFIEEITPVINKLLFFRGDLRHEVTPIEEIFSDNIKYRVSLVCEQYYLDSNQLKQIPDFLIRSDTSFSNFLKNEI
ncbi:MAG: 2OG-Fe(II) oxygenase [Candidatus Sericytochromatia bacterium]|nr:2OG-Fe(II) oxygenase [Candidatus Sericytochromatia bacterium]